MLIGHPGAGFFDLVGDHFAVVLGEALVRSPEDRGGLPGTSRFDLRSKARFKRSFRARQ